MGDAKQLLHAAEISLQLDTYDDIFSDFDPRPFSQRALSDDFLLEAKKAVRDREGEHIHLQFLMPRDLRNPPEEALIKRRLKDHFHRHYLKELEGMRRLKREGWMMALGGMCMILIATWIATFAEDTFLLHLLIILLEPGGWFTAWTGLDQLYYTARERQPTLDFYERMHQAEIVFEGY